MNYLRLPGINSQPRSESGLVVVEFAIGMALIALLLLACAELGNAYNTYNTLSKSVRLGARYMSINAIPAVVVDLSVNSGEAKNLTVTGDPAGGSPVLTGYQVSDITISEESPSGVAYPHVRVQADYAYIPLFAMISDFGYGNGDYTFQMNMQASSTMRILE